MPLASATNIEANVKLFHHLVRGGGDEPSLAAVLQELYRQLWKPLEPALPRGAKRIIIAPDGELNFVPFAALLTADGRFVGERYVVSHVSAGRDLLFDAPVTRSARNLVVVANPDFGAPTITPLASSNQALASPLLTMRGLRDLQFRPLPGSAREASLLRERAPALGFREVIALVGEQAAESRLREIRSPYALHLATHGFFLPEVAETAPSERDALPSAVASQGFLRLMSPMYRSGLALAGAQQTLRDLTKGVLPPSRDDGILTAEEVAGLRLEGTWLVVLSACDTGAGEARAGEGVFGLRRGFAQAGVRNLLMTLWPIDDERTVKIIADFYAAAHRTGDAPRALAEVQRDWLVRLRAKQGLAEACRVAGPFILNFQGRN